MNALMHVLAVAISMFIWVIFIVLAMTALADHLAHRKTRRRLFR